MTLIQSTTRNSGRRSPVISSSNSSTTPSVFSSASISFPYTYFACGLDPHRDRSAIRALTAVTTVLLLGWLQWTLLAYRAEHALLLSEEAQAAAWEAVPLTHGLVGAVPYYHCSAMTNKKASSSKKEQKQQQQPQHPPHIVLLHGSRFTKEDWRTSGILPRLCEYDTLAVTALDLSVQATPAHLLAVLDDLLVQLNMSHDGSSSSQHHHPIDALVTPSASGTTILHAAVPPPVPPSKRTPRDDPKDDNGRAEDNTTAASLDIVLALQTRIRLWMPVAANAAVRYTLGQLRATPLHDWPIVAVYGTEDAKGKESSDLLAAVSDQGQSVQLEGTHAVYFDVPEEFIDLLVSVVMDVDNV